MYSYTHLKSASHIAGLVQLACLLLYLYKCSVDKSIVTNVAQAKQWRPCLITCSIVRLLFCEICNHDKIMGHMCAILSKEQGGPDIMGTDHSSDSLGQQSQD